MIDRSPVGSLVALGPLGPKILKVLDPSKTTFHFWVVKGLIRKLWNFDMSPNYSFFVIPRFIPSLILLLRLDFSHYMTSRNASPTIARQQLIQVYTVVAAVNSTISTIFKLLPILHFWQHIHQTLLKSSDDSSDSNGVWTIFVQFIVFVQQKFVCRLFLPLKSMQHHSRNGLRFLTFQHSF